MSEINPQYNCEQMFNPNSVSKHKEPEYMQNKYSSLNRPVNVFASKPTVNLEELETDQLKHNTRTDYHDMGSSGQESEEAEIKEHAPASQTDQISKLNKTDLNLDDRQMVNEYFLGPENVQSQYISSCSISKDVKSEHTTNSELLEAAQSKQNTASADYTMGESEPKYEEQGKQWLNNNFFLIRCENQELPSIKWVLELAKAAVFRHGKRGLVIDPYNELDH